MTRIHLSVNIIIKTLVLQLAVVGNCVILFVLEPGNGVQWRWSSSHTKINTTGDGNAKACAKVSNVNVVTLRSSLDSLKCHKKNFTRKGYFGQHHFPS